MKVKRNGMKKDRNNKQQTQNKNYHKFMLRKEHKISEVTNNKTTVFVN